MRSHEDARRRTRTIGTTARHNRLQHRHFLRNSMHCRATPARAHRLTQDAQEWSTLTHHTKGEDID